MATLVLSTAGAALGSALGGPAFGLGAAAVGRALGGIAGGVIDQAVLGGGSRVVETGRVTQFRLMGSREGAGIPRIFGRMRVGAQVIWASRFRDQVSTSSARAGKGGPRIETRRHSYSVSLAIGLCEGPVERIGRIWADGALLEPGFAEVRLHRGGEDQMPDPLIEAIEGPGAAPAYRGLAYLVVEELELGRFGNRTPQFSVEVFREPRGVGEDLRLAGLVEAVALSPGSGEFSMDLTPVRRRLKPGETVVENVNSIDGRPDALVAFDQLQAEAPACKAAALIVSWFGDDLRCGRCTIRPKVEESDKETEPLVWRVGGMGRADVAAVGRVDGRPVYGGTPSDSGVVASIRELRRRGVAPMFYPFILMDVAPDSGLPDPYGGAVQPAYPWRGRITLDVAPGRAGSADATAAAEAEVAAFFGTARPEDFVREGDTVRYLGPPEWGLRRFILHYAHLCAGAGGVDAFCIGSELRGLTWIRAGTGVYPAVQALRALAADVRAVLGVETKIGYAADWSEYFGHQPADGSGDVFFHLDPLWADAAIDFIGVDNYMPLSDWRDGGEHADVAAGSVYALDYLRGGVEGGEGFDWFYPSAEDRRLQRRAPIDDGAYGEPWVFRYKDLRNWWSRPHHDRPGGERSATPTPWVPMSKPIWFTEIGCPAIDKGANQPNVFVDPKSSESATPHFSSGARDEHIQRRFLQATLGYWRETARNPVSPIYGGPMVDTARSFVWTWDLRPWPDFPQRLEVWSDGANHRLGHWITGRLGSADLAAIVAEICAEAGVAADVSRLEATVDGYALEAAQTARQALQPLMLAYGFDVAEAAGGVRFMPRAPGPSLNIDTARCVEERTGLGGPVSFTRAELETPPGAVRLAFAYADGAYEPAAVEARAAHGTARHVEGAELALALPGDVAEAIAQRWLREATAAREMARLALPPSMLGLEPGDVVSLADGGGRSAWRVERIVDEGARTVEARRVAAASPRGRPAPPARTAPTLPSREPVALWLVDPPVAAEDEPAHWPLAAAFARPWPGSAAVYRDDGAGGFALSASVERPATVGVLAAPLPWGAPDRWMRGAPLLVRLYVGGLQARSVGEVANGANLALVETGPDVWEALHFAGAELIERDLWRLGPLLRGQAGSGPAPGVAVDEGARFLLLDAAPARLPTPLDGLGMERALRWGPGHLPVIDGAFIDGRHTPRGAALRPLQPAHLRARRLAGGDVALRWIRRARTGGDAWSAGEPPLIDGPERYRVRIYAAGAVAREVEVSTASFVYGLAERMADGAAAGCEIGVAQVSTSYGPGAESRVSIDG